MIFLLISGYSQAASHYYAALAFRNASVAHINTSIEYQPNNPVAHEKHGLIRLRLEEYDGASSAFAQAIRYRENDHVLWLRLGYAHQKQQDVESAGAAYRRAIALAPRYSQPEYYFGRLLLNAGRNDEAFEHLSRAAAADPDLYPRVQRLARKTYVDDPDAIKAAVRPITVEAKRSLARYLIKYHFMTEKMRSFLLGDELSADEKDGFIKYLLRKEQFEMAREVWISKQNSDVSSKALPIFDGGFEEITASDKSGLGWQIDQTISATSVARVTPAHSGSFALTINLAGDVELRRPIISQIAYVQPGRRFRVTFYFKSDELISAGLPAVAVTDIVENRSLGVSAPFSTTKGNWTQGTVEFTAPSSGVTLVSLQRPACPTSPCPIFGNLSVDDFDLFQLN